MRRLAAALVAMAAAAPLPAAAEGPAEALAEAGARMTRAAEGLKSAPGDEAGVAALAAAMAQQEAALAGMRDAVIGAQERERALVFDLELRRAETASLLLALQSLSPAVPGSRALHPAGPLGAARAASMLAVLRPELQAEADALAARLTEIGAARALRARGVEDVGAALEDQAAARGVLTAALARRSGNDGGVEALAPAALLRDADSLSALADGLAALGAGDGAPEPADLALRWPVNGQLFRRFGEPDAAGVRRPGLLLEAPPLALVTAPAAGSVRYAGPFLDYGYVVVIEPRADVLVVLAGIAALETRSGAEVGAGDLLGLLGGRPLDAQEYLMLGDAGTGETPAETLYIELRQGQGPVDPEPWLGDRNE